MHRTTAIGTLNVLFPVHEGKQRFDVDDDHADEGADPHPEQCARSSHGHGCCGTCEVSVPDEAAQRAEQRLQRCDVSFTGISATGECQFTCSEDLRELKSL